MIDKCETFIPSSLAPCERVPGGYAEGIKAKTVGANLGIFICAEPETFWPESHVFITAKQEISA